MPFAFGVIGLGRMAQALVIPLIEQGLIPAGEVIAVVGRQDSVATVSARVPSEVKVVAASDPAAQEAWGASVQLLAVKPQMLDVVAASAPPATAMPVQRSSLLLSVLAGVPLARLQNLFPGRICVRAVPNTPCLVGQGLTGLAWGNGISDQQMQQVRSFFEPVSEVLELPEERLDAFLALTSSGPAYVALIAEAMADGAVAVGMPRAQAHHLAHRTLAGTAALLQEQELHPGELKDMVASPGGTTMAALRQLEKAGLRSALIEAVVAATEHGRGMAK
ncbi:MAG: pyrroline-5-carboxylate reductase [Synechococcus sp. SP2 MAG]|nr:pyrroline-5-carboxylate reductase [Synechococcus sp. SP2 MAG]